MNKQKCTNSIKEEIIMLAKSKHSSMENIDGVAMGVEAMYGVDIHPYYNLIPEQRHDNRKFYQKKSL